MTSVSTRMPDAILAGSDFLWPSTIRDAEELEKPSEEELVGTLIKGILRMYPIYLAASITLPPPMPIMACVLLGSSNARFVISTKSTVSIS